MRDINFPVPADKEVNGATTTATITLGGNSNNDRGNGLVSLRYLKTEALLQSERDYSACPLFRGPTGVAPSNRITVRSSV